MASKSTSAPCMTWRLFASRAWTKTTCQKRMLWSNAGMYTVSGWDAAKKTNANYSVTSPKVTITVNPHTLTSADIQSNDNWGAKDFTGEEQTFTAFKVPSTYNERTIDLVENQDYVIVDNSNKGIYSVVTLRIKAADGSTNYTGEARAPQSWSIRAFKVANAATLKSIRQTRLPTTETPKTPRVFAFRVVSTDIKKTEGAEPLHNCKQLW